MPLAFQFLDTSLRSPARMLASYFADSGYTIYIETPLSAAYPFRPTLLMKKRGANTLAMEVRSTIRVEDYFRDFVLECERAREPVQIYVAAPPNADEPLAITIDADRILKDLGIGVLVIEPASIITVRRARPQSHRFVLPPGPSLGRHEKLVTDAIAKFNDAQPIDAIRDMTEGFEESVRGLARKTSRKSRINITPAEADHMELENLINCLSTNNYRGTPQTLFLKPTLSNDLKSFKGTRNLSHHPRSPQKERQLHAEVFERMETAVRLIRVLLRIHRQA